MKTNLLILIFVALSLNAASQYLQILDPQTWRSGQGTIEESVITYEPQGLFMKAEWEITFSARGLDNFYTHDTVEVAYHFQLPEGAMVIDSWLWFGDTILKGHLIDRWTASQIYEEIVGRRRDPSILYKNGSREYELRIFPMAAKESRKVKITYLSPAEWTTGNVSTDFPSPNLMVSKYPVEVMKINAKLSQSWSKPVLTGSENIILQPLAAGDNGITHSASIDHSKIEYNQKFVLDSPLKSGPFLGFFQEGDDKFYQLAINPLEHANIGSRQKILFLLDYRVENSNITQQVLLETLKNFLISNYAEKDSFNILYHTFEIQQLSDSWIPGDSASVVAAFNSAGTNPLLVSYSNLATLVAAGIARAKTEPDTKIVVVSNSDYIDNIATANALLKDLKELAGSEVPVYIADFQTQNYNYYWAGNYNYRGNEYFYRNLARITGGDYCSSFDGKSLSSCLNQVYAAVSLKDGLMEIHTTLENGFCYGRFSPQDQNLFSSLPYLETGKYTGSFPFEIEISGEYQGEIFSDHISIPMEDAYESDSLLAKWWVGHEILEMEKQSDSYSTINDIIDISMQNRILTRYTAFLCLEPGMEKELEAGTNDEEFPVSADKQVEKSAIGIKAYPNPFSDKVQIDITIPGKVDRSQVKLEIYDLFGKLVKTFDAGQFDQGHILTIEWDATDEGYQHVPAGTYLFVCTTSQGRTTAKLVVM